MENLIIKEYRKEISTEKGKDGVLRTRTRPFVEFKCYHCQEIIEIRKNRYSNSIPCKECQKRLRGKKNFLLKAKEKFGNKFDLTKAEIEYFDATTPITVKCNIHNYEYKVNPTKFVSKPYPNQPSKGGCSKCAYEVQLTKNKKSIDTYLAIIENYYPDIKIINYGTAEHNQEKIKLSCPVHGDFEKTLAKVKHSTLADSCLCDKCTNEKHAWRTRMARTDIPGIVYFVYFKDVNLYKCGVTHKTTKERLKRHLHNIEIIWELPFNTLSDAYYFEAQFFRYYYQYKTNHPNSNFGGYTEFFFINLKKPSQPFIEEILCRKNLNSEKPLT